MSSVLKVIQVGMGPLGQMMTPRIAERSGLKLVGAVDVDPAKTGCDVGELCGGAPLGVPVSVDLDGVIGETKPNVAVVTTVSSLEAILPTVEALVSAGANVVSTCEELSYPWTTNPTSADRIDQAAKSGGASVLGTGINPGFLMDFLPAAVTGVCRHVRSVSVDRIQDASFRRLPFIHKIGAGQSVGQFRKLAAVGKIRHVGLTESMHMIAKALGWTLDRTEDVVEPVLAEAACQGDGWSVLPGQAAGVSQIGRGFAEGTQVITLQFTAAVGQLAPCERIRIDGEPPFEVLIPGGINGDVATCSVIANAIPAVAGALPGLRTMIDIAPLTCRT